MSTLRTTTRSLRHCIPLLLCVAVTGCSGFMNWLDEASKPAPWPYDKIPVYPRQVLDIPARELDNYKCVVGVLYCETTTRMYECQCVSVEIQ